MQSGLQAASARNDPTEWLSTRMGPSSCLSLRVCPFAAIYEAVGAAGILEAVRVLDHVKGIGLMEFSRSDVVRHRLVQAIIEAYERPGQSARGRGREPRETPGD